MNIKNMNGPFSILNSSAVMLNYLSSYFLRKYFYKIVVVESMGKKLSLYLRRDYPKSIIKYF